MYYQVLSGIVLGVKGELIRVEVDASNGMPYFSMVGYLSSEVKEAKERVITALRSVSFSLPPKRITVNFSPADIRKAGSSFDLPVAVAILGSFRLFPVDLFDQSFISGELSLEGEVRPVKGLLPMILEAKKQNIKRCFVPKGNEKELVGLQGIDIYLVSSLTEMLDHLRGKCKLEKLKAKEFPIVKNIKYPDFSEVAGQYKIKRALEIAAAGRHNVLLIGPAGCGKSMLARCVLGVFPQLEVDELQEVCAIYSAKGIEYENFGYPPVRNPHHTVPPSAFIGGGVSLNAGEISLCHNGVLLLDELAEFRRGCLEGLREPMENYNISISRRGRQFIFPSDIMVIATSNACPCGQYPDRGKCICNQSQRIKYRKKISRPLLERFDMILWVESVRPECLDQYGETSETIAMRILKGREIQKERYKNEPYKYNSRIPTGMIEEMCQLSESANSFVRMVFEQKDLSMREFHHMMKVARTIADLEGEKNICMEHLAEASSYYVREVEEL